MDQKRLILYLALLFIFYSLWQAWQKDYHMPAAEIQTQAATEELIDTSDDRFYSELDKYRKQINDIDENIIKLLAERQKVILAIGKYKAKTGTEVVDLKREQQLREFYAELSTKYGLDSDFVNHLFKVVIMESRRLQEADKPTR